MQAKSIASAASGYEPFFGFHDTPFRLAPDPRFLYETASHRAGLAQITHALERREPIVVVTGAIGTGKTLLCRTVLDRIDRKTFVSIVDDPRLERDDLLKQMLVDFGVGSRDRTTWTPARRHDLMRAIQEFLSSIAPLGAQAVLIVDEAQHLQPDVLEDVRLLSNIHDERGTMLQIVLAGQPGLEELLRRPELGQVKQRVSRYVRLEPLTASEVARYVEHRLSVARERPVRSMFPGVRELQRELAEWEFPDTASTFTPEAVWSVAQLSNGVPRVVNLLCDRALEAAYARQSRVVDHTVVAAAADALGLRASSESATRPTNSTAGNNALRAPVAAPADDDDAPVATATASTPVSRTARAPRYAIAVGVLALAIVAAWVAQRELSQRREGGPDPQSQRAVETAAPARPASPIGAAPTDGIKPPATTPAPTAPSETSAPPIQRVDAYEIVVASFHTVVRANEVVAQLATLGERARVRQTPAWQQVIAGPYRSKADGEEAQQRLTRAGFAGSQLGPATQ